MNNSQYLSQFKWKWLSFDYGSDYHFDLKNYTPKKVSEIIKKYKKNNILIFTGDLYDNFKGKDLSQEVEEVLNRLVGLGWYEYVLYTPGNHDIRSIEKPFCRSKLLNERVIIPENYVKKITLSGVNILLWNVMYEPIIPPEEIDIKADELNDFYKKISDWKFIKDLNLCEFSQMAEIVRSNLNKDIDIIITHPPIHPYASIFMSEEKTHNTERLIKKYGVKFLYGEEAKEKWEKTMKKWGPEYYMSFKDFIDKFWNLKSILIGSNLLNWVDFQDGLLSIFGHIHRSMNDSYIVDWKTVNFLSFRREEG